MEEQDGEGPDRLSEERKTGGTGGQDLAGKEPGPSEKPPFGKKEVAEQSNCSLVNAMHFAHAQGPSACSICWD